MEFGAERITLLRPLEAGVRAGDVATSPGRFIFNYVQGGAPSSPSINLL